MDFIVKEFAYIQLLVSVLVAIIVAIITSRLALKSFYKQEIWLRKEKLYSEIINGLSKIQDYYGKLFEEWTDESQSKMTNEQHKETSKIRRELKALAISPNILLKEEIHKILKELYKSENKNFGNENAGDLVSFFDRMYGEVQEANKKITAIAKKDLKLKK